MRSTWCLLSALLIVTGCTTQPETDDRSTTISPSTTETPPVSTTTSSSPTSAIADEPPADTVIRGGVVLTQAGDQPLAEGVAIRGSEIVSVGGDAELTTLIGPDTVVLDVDGRAVVPGFVDAHSHYYGAAMSDGQDLTEIQDQMLSAGVTTVGEAAVDEGLLAEMQALDGAGLLRVRSSLYLLADTACGELTGDWQFGTPPTRERGERLRIGGIKLYTDGGSCNAPAVSYHHGFGGSGHLYFSADELAALIDPYDAAGYQVVVHALGDRAVEETLAGLEMVIGDSGNPLRHRIDHNAVVRPEMRGRYDEAGAVAVIFGSFGTCAYLGLDERFRFNTPIEYQEWEWPWRDLLDLNPNTVFAWHGDYPVFEDSGPIASVVGFVTRSQTLGDGTRCDPEPYHSKHAISVEEALHLMTAGSAYALDRDTEVGSVEVGKLADLVVLSADPRQVPQEGLADLSVELTILDGEVVHCGAVLFESLCDSEVSEPDPSEPVALEPTASSSLSTNSPALAVDGDLETHWSAGADAPQWIEIPLDPGRRVVAVRLVVDQFPPGPTTHIVWGRRADDELVQLAERTSDTDMFDVLEIEIDAPEELVAIRIETTSSPSWVAWREIDIVSD
jgi:predicted amidohydrolase YtcJ